ncbi:glycosyltransferase family 4 protein [Rhodoplanes sp. TEM]|uniref:Glycosyltransferase family 4 protein n=1 Tax=Rhodoplanes tepidamans TaxID=200616 RepID=A0ABT5JCH1_RHOTP|nr:MULTISPECIES: glycosyltransferase family 4 protein [Rhodoplanes]MDC7787143.1 glycosyltransferase family 4 protein [Rhodoplanes tepidamans]MDC7984293.1 glycosyltransferase family 4 protein [Rhodoplanes sp. TEM]MDQ0356090.1 UDP-glucose:(heptosyl)LPS alpha-1,3-glucosyltransferase [Rhodoplanes tepidamans]
MTLEIIQIVQELSSVGGVESVALELAGVFGRAGVANTVIASNVGDVPDRRTMVERVAPWLARVPTRGALRHLGRALVVPLFTVAATAAARRHRGAVVISHGDSLMGDVLVVHAVNAESLAEKRRAGSWRWLLNPTHLWVAVRDRWMIGGLRYRMFVAVSSRVADELQRHYGVPPSRIRVIPNGIDLQRFRADTEAGARIRTEFGIPPEAKLLLFVGHEFDRKGLVHAVGALELLDADTWLLVVGSENPAPFRRMAKRSGDRLVFAGARRDVAAFYAAADAFVFPTSYETFSLVCMEAMAAEVPVFATAVGGIEDYLRDGVNGYRIAADAADIAAKLRNMFDDPALRQRLRIGARATAERYGWDRIGAEYIALAGELNRPPAVAPNARTVQA